MFRYGASIFRHIPRTRRVVVLAIVLGVLTGACSGGGEDPATDSQQGSVVTDDKILTIEGAADATAQALDGSDLPDELTDLDLSVPVYELGPEATRFDDPVTLTFRIPIAEGTTGLPYYVLAVSDGSGKWEPLADQRLAIEGGSVVASGTTTHFSLATAFGGAVTLELTPDSVVAEVGKGFTVDVNVIERSKGSFEFLWVSAEVKDPQILRPGPTAPKNQNLSFDCLSVGQTPFSVLVSLTEPDITEDMSAEMGWLLLVAPADLDIQSYVTLSGGAQCTRGPSRAGSGTGGSQEKEDFQLTKQTVDLAFEDGEGDCGFPSEFTGRFTVSVAKAKIKLDQGNGQVSAGPIDAKGRFVAKGKTGGHSERYAGVVDKKNKEIRANYLYENDCSHKYMVSGPLG